MSSRFSWVSCVIGVIIGLLIAGVWFTNGDTLALIEGSSERTRTTNNTTIPESGAVSVSDQAAGSEVVVDSVTVPAPGIWVVVRETTGSELGNTLGAARVGSSRTAVSVPLLRNTESGRTYAVELYRDDNDGVFDVTVNSVYVDFDTSAPVIARFKTLP